MTDTHHEEAAHLKRVYDEAVRECLGVMLPVHWKGEMLSLGSLREQLFTGEPYDGTHEEAWMLASGLRPPSRPGERIVREGMGDVIHWTRQCSCYQGRGFCPWFRERIAGSFRRMEVGLNVAGEGFRRAGQAISEALGSLREK